MGTLKPTSYLGVPLSVAQVGNGASTNICDRGNAAVAAALLTIVSTIGATPTVTVDIQGSADGADWWNVAWADPATPTVWAVTALTITTATTTRRILKEQSPWQYLRLNYSANTNVTLTGTLYVFGNA